MRKILFSAVLLLSSGLAHANDDFLVDVWSANTLKDSVNTELANLDDRKREAIAAYNDLSVKLNAYDGWCNTYGLTALRNVLEGQLFLKLFTWSTEAAYAGHHVYSNDPYFANFRARVDEALNALHTTSFDVGKCMLTEQQNRLLKRDPRQFEKSANEFKGGSYPYVLLAGNIRLLDEEREILLELKGRIDGSGNVDNARTVEDFIRQSMNRLRTQTAGLRSRTLEGYELSFRVPFGPMEQYRGRDVGSRVGDQTPNFFWIFERRAFYVNQARLAAGKFFEVSVNNYTAADALGDQFVTILREASTNGRDRR